MGAVETVQPIEQTGSRRRWHKVLAVCLAVLDLFLIASYAILYALNGARQPFHAEALAFSTFPLLGAIITAKQPRNVVGWLICTLGLVFVLGDVLPEYATYALITRPGALPLGEVAVWLAVWSWTLGFAFVIAIFLLIPNGRPLTKRWRIVIWLGAVLVAALALPIAVLAWPIRGPVLLTEGDFAMLGDPDVTLGAYIDVVFYAVIAVIAVAVVGLVTRFIRSRGVERQQLKWIVVPCALVPFSFVLNELVTLLNSPALGTMGDAVNTLSIVGLPVSIAIAILRYRLYDIDLIIRRTLVYGVLTALLALVFFGLVFVLQRAFAQFTAQQSEQQSDIAVVASTLTIAVLALPLRNRIQAIIDRRFYRKKYDAERVVEAFAARLQNATDEATLAADLKNVIQETLQPASVKIWLVSHDDGKGRAK